MCAPPISRISHILRGVVALLMTAALARIGEAQAPRDTMPASLLRRLAEAADAHRSGGLVWFVADPRPPHDIDDLIDLFIDLGGLFGDGRILGSLNDDAFLQ